MTRLSLILRSLAHYWRWHLGLFAGVALTAAVIAGSLITGDSVRATLARQADLRLGSVATAAAAADGFYTESLAEKTRALLPPQSLLEPALFLQASVTMPDTKQRRGGVNLYGVQPGYWQLAPGGTAPPVQNGIAINEALARALGLTHPGAEVLLRFEKPGFLSRDAPLSGESDQIITERLPVAAIVPDDQFGAFSLSAGGSAPCNAWLPLAKLQELTGLPQRANLLLSTNTDAAALERALDAALTIEDAGLTLTGDDATRVLATSRIFLSDDLAARVTQTFPRAEGVLTYLVNEIHAHGKLTPYSFATAAALPGAQDATVHQWLADDLGLNVGDSLRLKFYRVTRARQIEEAEAEVKVGRIVAMDDPLVRRDWTPNFPGITESENCRDWKPGFPVKQDLIREQDDAYWRTHKGTPKLWLDRALGQSLWANRFGSLTSFRIPTEGSAADMAGKLAAALTPAEAGLTVVDVRASASRAVGQSMDFGMLFAAMSSFLIAAALLLAALLFVFGIGQRARQCGVLRATGWTGKQVRGLFLREGFAVSLPAALLGAAAGLLYARWTLGKLEHDWADAALGMRFYYIVRPLSLGIAAAVTLLLAGAVIWWSTRRLLRAQPRELLAGAVSTGSAGHIGPIRRIGRIGPILTRIPTGTAAAIAMAMLLYTPRAPQHIAPMLFFGAAFLLLVDGLRVLHRRLGKMDAGGQPGHATVWALGLRNAARRRGRSVALAGLMALGIFMVTALNAFRQDARLMENTRSGGAGGFAFVGECTQPIYEDMNSAAGQKTWDFDPGELAGVNFVPFRVRDGEEASCLNLNRAQTPRVMGLSSAAMPAEAFPFASAIDSAARWKALDATAAGDALPAIMDQYSAMFALGKQQGDIITVPDGKGATVKLQLVALLAGSVLQGNVIISEQHFVRLYPDTKGYRYFLIDAPAQNAETFRAAAVQQLASRDFTLTPAVERLAQFQAVQNTYLTIFSTLGGLALLLSTAGLGVLVARNVMERRAEFALLSACGFRPQQLRLMVLAEHWFLFLAAIVLGSGAALLAVWPNLKLAGAGGMPLGLLALILAALLAGGLLFCWTAARLAITRRITAALRWE